MKIIKNEQLIKRNGRIGQWTTIAALVILGGGMYVSFTDPTNPNLFPITIGSLLGGFILTQVSMYFGNRWGRSPRPDEMLDSSLKGLPGDYTIYHFKGPASHVLVGPAGIWTMIPYRQRGVVTYYKNRWRLSGGGFMQAYMSIFGQEGLGRPDLEAEGEINAIRKTLARSLGEGELPEIKAVLVFTSDQIEIQAEAAPLPAVKIKQLKDFFRQRAKEKPIGQMQLAAVKAALPQE